MSRRPRWHCTACQSPLAVGLQRGTVKLYPARVTDLYALANGHLLLVCCCGRRNLLRSGAKLLTAAPADQGAQGGESAW